MTTQRLGFSTWAEDQLADALELWGEPEVSRFISANGRFTEEQIRQRLQTEIENLKQHGVQYWPVYLRETGMLAGCCGLRPCASGENTLEMGVHLKKECWGQGLASEACGAVIDHAFGTLGAEALFAGHNPKNTASAQMLKKLGFRYTHDEFYEPTGLNHPSYLLTKEEWMKRNVTV